MRGEEERVAGNKWEKEEEVVGPGRHDLGPPAGALETWHRPSQGDQAP